MSKITCVFLLNNVLYCHKIVDFLKLIKCERLAMGALWAKIKYFSKMVLLPGSNCCKAFPIFSRLRFIFSSLIPLGWRPLSQLYDIIFRISSKYLQYVFYLIIFYVILIAKGDTLRKMCGKPNGTGGTVLKCILMFWWGWT